MAREINVTLHQDIYGNMTTNDEELNRIIREVEEENGAKIAGLVPAVTFDSDPETKPYLILLTVYDLENEETIRDWQVKVGRQNVYDYLKDLVVHEDIDPNTSFIIAGEECIDETSGKDNVRFNDIKPITVFRFLKVMYDRKMVLDDGEGFNIDEYDLGQYDKGDETIMYL